jgi:hypothetical protein
MPLSSFKIGTSAGTLTNIESLSTPLPVPRAPFKPYARASIANSGRSQGKGFPSCQWIFSRLTPAQREQLRTFCTGASAVVYIQTMTNDKDTPHSVPSDSYQVYQAIMNWPEEKRYPAKTHDRLELTIDFTHMVLQ